MASRATARAGQPGTHDRLSPAAAGLLRSTHFALKDIMRQLSEKAHRALQLQTQLTLRDIDRQWFIAPL